MEQHKETQQARAEAIEINNFIKNWQEANEYKGNFEIHNAKFKADFNSFLQSKNYSQQTINLFKID